MPTPRYAPEYVTPEALARLDRTRERLLRLDRGLPPEEPCACPDPPRRRPVVVHGLTAAERQLLATGPPPPPPVAVRGQARRGRVTLADAKDAGAPWADSLVASGYRRLAYDVRSVAVQCAHCGVRHRLDFQCEPARNRTGSYSAVVANGGRL